MLQISLNVRKTLEKEILSTFKIGDVLLFAERGHAFDLLTFSNNVLVVTENISEEDLDDVITPKTIFFKAGNIKDSIKQLTQNVKQVLIDVNKERTVEEKHLEIFKQLQEQVNSDNDEVFDELIEEMENQINSVVQDS